MIKILTAVLTLLLFLCISCNNNTTRSDDSNMMLITKVTNHNKNVYLGNYTPDGEKIIYIVSGDQQCELFSVNADGSNPSLILDPVAFSPDDTKILFYSTRGREDSSQYWDIYIIKTDGTELRQLTNNEYRDYPLCFSPDGSKILFHSDRDGTINLFTMSVD